jgi:hypothetical protein
MISIKDKQNNINVTYTLLSYLRTSLNGYFLYHLWLSFQKKREMTRTNLTQVSALPKHMSKSIKDNHGSKGHLSPNDTIVSK